MCAHTLLMRWCVLCCAQHMVNRCADLCDVRQVTARHVFISPRRVSMSTIFTATDKAGSTLEVSATESGVVFKATNKEGATAVASLAHASAQRLAADIKHYLVTR